MKEKLTLNRLDATRVTKNFYKHLEYKGTPSHIVGWESADSQYLRFHILASHVPLEGRSILDVGCGIGELYQFLQELHIRCFYRGIDLLPRMVKKARERFQNDSVFMHSDFFTEDVLEPASFSLIYSSGMYNLRHNNNIALLYKGIEKMKYLTSEYIVFNLLSDTAKNPEPAVFYYYNTDQVYQICKEIGFSTISIDDSYKDNDFSIILKR